MVNKRQMVVIGGDAAEMTAASRVRREQPEHEIVVFERGKHASYSACGMPYRIGGQVESEEDLIARKPEVFREKQHIDVRIRHEVTEIDPKNKRVKVKNKITIPTLIMHGKKDKICSFDLAEQMKASILNSHLVVFEKSGHSLFLEETEKFNRELIKFAETQKKA